MGIFLKRKSESYKPKTHHVRPHMVRGYRRKDGTYVSGYFRDGDGNTKKNSYKGYTALNPGQKKIAQALNKKGK